MGTRIHKYISIFLLLLCAVALPFGASVMAEVPIESKVKAAFVVNFARFINWPEEVFADAGAPLTICIVGPVGSSEAFAGVESKMIKGHPLALQNFVTLDGIGSASCQLLYLSKVPEKNLNAYLTDGNNDAVVSIGESVDFARRGGIIEFVKIKDRLSFKINNSKAKQRRIHINASLLDLAEEVY